MVESSKQTPVRIVNVSSQAHLRWQKPIDYQAHVVNETVETYDTWSA